MNKFSSTKFLPLSSNETLYDLNKEIVDTWHNEEMKEITMKVLEDFKDDELYRRKRFIFSKEYPVVNNEMNESFYYYIYNRVEDFQETYFFLKQFFDESLLDKFDNFLKKSNLIFFNYFVKDDQLNKGFYFKINDFTIEELDKLTQILNLKFDYQNIWSIGIIFLTTGEVSYKLFYDHEKLNSSAIKNFLTDIKLENKMPMLRFANSLLKPVSNVLLCKELINGEVVSKSIDVSLTHNTLRLRTLGILFNANTKYFDNKKVSTLSMQVSNSDIAKISFYYSPRLEAIEEEIDYGYHRH